VGKQASHLGESRIGDIRGPRKLQQVTESGCLLGHAVELHLAWMLRRTAAASPAALYDDESRKPFEQVLDESTRSRPVWITRSIAVNVRCIPSPERIDDLAEQVGAGCTRAGPPPRACIAPGRAPRIRRDELVEQR
jgi:hypothetical protein